MDDFEIELEVCAYEEDKVIGNVLCFLADGKWIEYSKEALTEMLIAEQDGFNEYIDRVYESQE